MDRAHVSAKMSEPPRREPMPSIPMMDALAASHKAIAQIRSEVQGIRERLVGGGATDGRIAPREAVYGAGRLTADLMSDICSLQVEVGDIARMIE
jgi:hypothetical protein